MDVAARRTELVPVYFPTAGAGRAARAADALPKSKAILPPECDNRLTAGAGIACFQL
jgi:hypothetical protein